MQYRFLVGILILSLGLNVYFALELSSMRTSEQKIEDVAETPTTIPPAESVFQSGEMYPFLRVVDGDTITVGIGSRSEYVRLIGIDAPEPNDPGGPECYASESTTHLATLLLNEGTVRLVFDATQGLRDKYNRLLAYVELQGGSDVALSMLENGYAREYLYDAPYERRDMYLAAESIAAREQRGLWSSSLCN